MANVLLIEDNQKLRELVSQALREKGFVVVEADTAELGIKYLAEDSFALVISDLKLPKASGMDVLRYISENCTRTVSILITAYGTVDVAVEAMKLGAFDLIQKPFTVDVLDFKVEKAFAHKNMVNEIDYLRHERKIIYKHENMIGDSRAIKAVFSKIDKVAKSHVTVLINGETGTGKELIAGCIHYGSDRDKKSFIKVNCAAIPDDLLESELFGHEKGAFTGADRQRIGRFEQADGGTIFLDEIGDMSPKTQAKVLRVLQEKEFERVGAAKTIKVDVRIIAATNKCLKDMVDNGDFREDLYYRLNVVSIVAPPLRERGDDVVALAAYFLKKYSRELQKDIKGFSASTIRVLKKYHWPGNIRELENSIERAALMVDGNVIEPSDIGIPISEDTVERDLAGLFSSSEISLPEGGISLQEVEKSLVIQALEASDWVQKDAAKLLSLSRRVMHYKIERYGIRNDKWIKNK